MTDSMEIDRKQFVIFCYKAILDREPDPNGLATHVSALKDGISPDVIMRNMVRSKEFFIRFAKRNGYVTRNNDKFPESYETANSEAGKAYQSRRVSGFFDRFMSGDVVLDIGYKGYDNPELRTVVRHATGVDLDYPGYDGLRLPFNESSVDCVFSSHCLEHIVDYRVAIRDWHRVAKVGGYIVCAVPSQLLYEKRRKPPSKFNADHKRFYSPSSLLREFEQSLPENSYRVRYLEENDLNYDYAIPPDNHATGSYEIVLVIEKIKPPLWRINS